MTPEGKHIEGGKTIDCSLKPVFENELKHWAEFRIENRDDHDNHYKRGRDHDMRLTKLETKVALYAAVAGILGGVFLNIVERYLP